MKHLKQSTQKQQGMATVLIVLLVGVSMTAIALGLAGSVKSSQQTQTAVHAVTHAQSAAWAAVHMYKDYLAKLAFEDVEKIAVNTNVPIAVTNMHQTLTIAIVAVDTSQKNTAGILVTANIRAHDSSADSTTTIQVVYQVGNSVCELCQVLGAAISLYDDTVLGGDITIAMPEGEASVVNIKGDVNAKSIAFNGVTRLNATGDVTLGSAIPLQEVYTNGNLILDGSANVAKASALGTITTIGNGHADLMYANQAISLGGGAVATAYSRSDINTTNWANHGDFHAGGNVRLQSPVQKVRAKGNVEQTAWAQATDVIAEGDVTCPDAGWNLFDTIVAGGALINCISAGSIKVDASETVAVMAELTPIEQVQPRIDAWAVKASANYAFEYELGKIKITVNNVNGISNGVYYLGDYPDSAGSGYRDYLCDAVDNRGQCTLPATPGKTMCHSYSTSNDCINFDSRTRTWRINGHNLPPGIVWFDGNLALQNGRYYNSFITTEDLATSNDHQTAAPNYIGYTAICELNYPQYPTNRFADMYPTQLCDMASGKMKYDPLANIAYLAGGFKPVPGNVYSGGNITLSASNSVYGTVLAGNNLKTFGDIRIYGYISAAAHEAYTTENDLGGRTIVDLSNLPASYRPQEIPTFNNGSCASACSPPAEAAKVLWARYL